MMVQVRRLLEEPGMDKLVAYRKKKDHFIFTIESTGIMSPDQLLMMVSRRCGQALAALSSFFCLANAVPRAPAALLVCMCGGCSTPTPTAVAAAGGHAPPLSAMYMSRPRRCASPCAAAASTPRAAGVGRARGQGPPPSQQGVRQHSRQPQAAPRASARRSATTRTRTPCHARGSWRRPGCGCVAPCQRMRLDRPVLLAPRAPPMWGRAGPCVRREE